MKDFIKGIPWAVLIAAVGAVWQLIYAYIRDRSRDKEEDRKHTFERAKFENQKTLELIRFEYEQRRWREQLATQLSLKHVDARLTEYAHLWSYVRVAAKHNAGKSLTPEKAKDTAAAVETWRYSSGGLLAEEITRDAALAFQGALWNYDASEEGYNRIRQARRLLRDALRSDLGLGEDSSGQTIFDAAERRQKIKEDITVLQKKLGMGTSSDAV
jgi:hypothetical protein